MNRTPAATAARPTTLHFSTDSFPQHARIDAWRDFSWRVLKYHVEPYARDAFRAETAVQNLPALCGATGSSTGSRMARPSHMVGGDDLVLSIVLAGQSRYAMSGREAICGPGDGVLVGGGESGSKESLSDGRSVGLQVSRSALASRVTGLGDLMCRRIPAHTPFLQLLSQYIGIIDAQVLAMPELQRQIASHLTDLIVLALGATRDAAEVAQARGGRAAQLHAVTAAIEQHLADPRLSATWVGGRLGLSERSVQRLFAGAGTTFSDLVRSKRLDRARQLLQEPVPRRITEVAFTVGFGDLSYFNRAFRQRFGCAPSDLMRQHQGDPSRLARPLAG